MAIDHEQRVRERAYVIWQKAGYPEGKSVEHWLQAEAEIAAEQLKISEIRDVLSELNELCHGEYGIPLEQLLVDETPIAAKRMERLTGIILKKKFATPFTRDPSTDYSETEARRKWPWTDGPPAESAADAEKELKLLNQLRMPGPWNGSATEIDWDRFKGEVDHERGLFKIVALYVADKVKGVEGKTLREYLDVEESRQLELGLDLAVVISDFAVVGPLMSLLGVPSVAVGLTLVGMRYGYRKLTDPDEDRLPDAFS